MGVKTALTDGIDDSNVMVSSPENYVKQAMSKVTSGVHAGYFPHEIIGLIWTNLNDIMPYTFCQTFFTKVLESHEKEFNAKKAKKSN